MVHFANRARVNNETRRGTQTGLDQMLMHGAGGEQRRNRCMLAIHITIRQNQHVVTFSDAGLGAGTQCGQGGLRTLGAFGSRKGDVQHQGTELATGELVDLTQLGQIGRG